MSLVTKNIQAKMKKKKKNLAVVLGDKVKRNFPSASK